MSQSGWRFNVSDERPEKKATPITSKLRKMSIVVPDRSQFQYIIRLLNTNIEGKRKIMYAMTAIKGIGPRYSNLVLKKADVDLNKRYLFLILTL